MRYHIGYTSLIGKNRAIGERNMDPFDAEAQSNDARGGTDFGASTEDSVRSVWSSSTFPRAVYSVS